MAKMRVGYIVDDIDQPFIVWDLIRKSKESSSYAIAALIVQRSVRIESTGILNKTLNGLNPRSLIRSIERALFAAIEKFEKFLVIRYSKYEKFFHKYPLEILDVEKIYVRSPISQSGSKLQYDESDLQKIRGLRLDLLLMAGGETHQANDVRLYKCLEFPLRWQLHGTLKKDISAADTNIFALNGRWWMFTNVDTAGIGDHASELHIFFADTFDSEGWIPHPGNPVIFDSLRARNGGLIVHDGDIYRVFQTQAFDLYGASMGVAKIIELSVDTYLEESVFSVPPTFFKNIRGTHSFAFDKGVLALDFLKYERFKN